MDTKEIDRFLAVMGSKDDNVNLTVKAILAGKVQAIYPFVGGVEFDLSNKQRVELLLALVKMQKENPESIGKYLSKNLSDLLQGKRPEKFRPIKRDQT